MLSNTSPRPRAVANYFIYDKSLTLNQPNFFGKSDFQDGETFLQLYGQFLTEVLGPRAIPQANSLILPGSRRDSRW